MGRKITRKPVVSESAQQVINRLQSSGTSPVEVMIKAMRELDNQYQDAVEQAELSTNDRDREAIRRYGKDCLRDACEIAKNVAPYFHPRLQAVTLAGDPDKPPVGVELTNVDDLRKMVRGGRTPDSSKATEDK